MFFVQDLLIHHLTDRAERYLSFDVGRSMLDVGRSNLRFSRAAFFVDNPTA